LIHAGDFSTFAKKASQFRDFNDWLGELPHAFKLVVPGNHDFALEDPRMRDSIFNATLLIEQGVNIAGLQIWSSPTTTLGGWAFAISKPEQRKRHWAQVPGGIDILITHEPPFGILDVPRGTHDHEGDPELLDAVNRAKPRLHVFGHIHGAHGTEQTEHTKFVNAAVFGEFGDLDKPPVIIDLDRA
jgi:Icc-related predicted phosphoesterase